MNLTDLKQVLDERSEGSAEHVMQHVRLHGVRAKVVSRRRRRAAAWGACVVVALVGVVATVVPGLRTDERPPPPAATPSPQYRMIEGFPEYDAGTRVVAAGSAPLSRRRLELTVVPWSGSLMFSTRCDEPSDTSLGFEITADGRRIVAGSCGALGKTEWDDRITPEKPVTLVVTITRAEVERDGETSDVPVPNHGSFAVAIGKPVPFEEYPLPPRPSGSLAPLEGHRPFGCTERECPGVTVIRSDPTDPTRPVRRTLAWKHLDSVDMVAQTPGFLQVRINGVEVATGDWWNYAAGGHGALGDLEGNWEDLGLDLRTGDRVTVEVVPEHMTGAWQVVLTPVGAGP